MVDAFWQLALWSSKSFMVKIVDTYLFPKRTITSFEIEPSWIKLVECFCMGCSTSNIDICFSLLPTDTSFVCWSFRSRRNVLWTERGLESDPKLFNFNIYSKKRLLYLLSKRNQLLSVYCRFYRRGIEMDWNRLLISIRICAGAVCVRGGSLSLLSCETVQFYLRLRSIGGWKELKTRTTFPKWRIQGKCTDI